MRRESLVRQVAVPDPLRRCAAVDYAMPAEFPEIPVDHKSYGPQLQFGADCFGIVRLWLLPEPTARRATASQPAWILC